MSNVFTRRREKLLALKSLRSGGPRSVEKGRRRGGRNAEAVSQIRSGSAGRRSQYTLP